MIGTLYTWQHRAREWAAGRLCLLRRGRAAAAGRAAAVEPRRVVLVVAGLIGDTVMSTPVIVEARRLWPRARITLLGRRHNCELLAACPHVDECHATDALPFTLRRRREIARLEEWLRAQSFDAALLVLGDQYAHVVARAGVPVRVGVSGHPLTPCLTHTYDYDPRTWGPRERLDALRSLGHEVPDSPPRLWVADEARASARRRLAELGLAPGERYVVLHPFGSSARQRWPVERAAALARELWRAHAVKTLLAGGPEARGQLPGGHRGLIDVTGAFGLGELLAVVEGAALVVTTDSGPFHIAGALARPLVGLFRSSRPEHAGRYAQARVVFGRDPACEGVCRWDRCGAQPCRQLLSIPVGAVLEEAGRVLSGREVEVSPQ